MKIKNIVIPALASIVISINLGAKELDRVYAIVNDDVITKSEYDPGIPEHSAGT